MKFYVGTFIRKPSYITLLSLFLRLQAGGSDLIGALVLLGKVEKVPGNETQNSFHEALDETNVIAENTDFELPAPRVVGKSMYKSNVGSATDVESNN